MNREDIIRMAREAGFADGIAEIIGLEGFARFAALVAAHEREACCKIVHGQCGSDNVAQRTVNAIRARGEKV